jgi:HEPN domain-containing protein
MRDLRHAEYALREGDYEWAAFAAQQSAEKVFKAPIMSAVGVPWGHSITGLAEAVPEDLKLPSAIMDAANRLDKHYIPVRNPNGFAEGYPG